MKKIKLSSRLSVVASFVEKGAVCADIGTDHGYVPVYLMQNGLAKSVIASDINKAPLDSAVRSCAEYGVNDGVSFVCAAGLCGIEPNSVDTVIIAGMGGETIMGILRDAPWTKSEDVSLILQPQSKIEEFTEFLYENNYKPLRAELVKDSGRIYIVVEVSYSEDIYDKDEYFIRLLAKDPLLCEYVSDILKKLKIKLSGISSSAKADETAIDEIKIKIESLEGLGVCYGKG